MPIQKPDLPAPSPLDLADPIYAPEAVRRRIRARWERRRAETAEPLQLHVEVPGLGWAVPVSITDAAQTLEECRVSLLITRPAPPHR